MTDTVFTGAPRRAISAVLAELIERRLLLMAPRAPLAISSHLTAMSLAQGQLALIEGWLRSDHPESVEALSRALGASATAAALAIVSMGDD